ncbi:hypothetical protein BO71DRAFT_431016 [Aspergillus ellipticus CBS 707.79]|uniref:Uncharacterized protein n=1 Tax=Aspergillus ellipticus CBS 707.79 TaxID=1448320 RepID=A0A319D7D0_9EURO|nr:hypothetical protein BO71DRAFT_431016 [Aspergillus ellipticus CBS 707.79]
MRNPTKASEGPYGPFGYQTADTPLKLLRAPWAFGPRVCDSGSRMAVLHVGEILIAAGPVMVLMLFFPETSSATILYQRSQRLNKICPSKIYRSVSEIAQADVSFRVVLAHNGSGGDSPQTWGTHWGFLPQRRRRSVG